MSNPIGQTQRIRRAIMASLQPLTGTRGAATATVSLEAGGTENVTLCKNSFCYPIPESAAGVASVEDQMMLRVTSDVIVPAGGPAATALLASVMGGRRFNSLESGTRLLWDPPIAGIEAVSTLSSAMTGAAEPGADLFAKVEDVTAFEAITGVNQALQLFQARLQGRVPACVIAWERSEEPQTKGKGLAWRDNVWTIFVVVENTQGEQPRRDQGLWIMDAVEGFLHEKGVVDGYPFSDPPATVMGKNRIAVTDTSLVYAVELRTHNALPRINLKVIDIPGIDPINKFTDLERFKLTTETCDDPPAKIVDCAEFENRQDAFDDGFSEGFG